MNKNAYTTAMQKINISEKFKEDTINKILEEETDIIKNFGNNDSAKYNGYSNRRKYTKAAGIVFCIFVLTSGITAAAAQFNILDIFKGYFKQPVNQQISNNSSGNSNHSSFTPVVTEPIKKENEFLEQASDVLSSSTTAHGLKLTARGVVGDRNNAYIAVDVETENGKAFNNAQKKDMSGITFSKVWLKVNEDKLGQYCYITRVDDGSQAGKATFVLKDSLGIKKWGNEAPKHLSLTFTNLIEPDQSKYIDIGSTKSVYEIMQEIGEASEDDFDYMDASSEREEDRTWSIEKREQIIKELKEQGITNKKGSSYDSYYGIINDRMEKAVMERGGFTPHYFIKRTKKQAVFCTKYPKLAISNLGIRNNQLIIKFEFNNAISYESFMDAGICLRNKKNGTIISFCSGGGGAPVNGNDESQSDIVNNKMISCNIQFSGISSKEELKDYYLVFGGKGMSYRTLVEGEWKLNFDLNYQDTTREYPINQKILVGGVSRELTKLELSPISLKLSWKAAKEMDASAEDTDNNVTDKIKIILSNGSEIVLDQYEYDDNSISSVLPMVIDLDQVDTIEINGVGIKLNSK